jgi:alpha-tubulin suppressor-like RCC1 family protein
MSDRYPGGLIRKTPPTITPPVDGEGGSAPGIWTLEQVAYYTKEGTWPLPVLPRELYAWGYNLYGQLGVNNTTTISSPVQVGSDIDWAETFTVTELGTLAIKENGTLWSWGRNEQGQLGQNNVINSSSPIQVGALTNWSLIAGGDNHCVAVKTDGTLWAWGDANTGKLGNNASVTVDVSSPIQIGSDTNWLYVDAAEFGSVGIKTDGTLWAWGGNSNGTLGLNDTVDRSSPVQVGANTDWTKVVCGERHTVGLTTTLELYSWGYNAHGNLGLNDTIRRSSPVQVGALTNWSQVSTGKASVAVKTDNTLWAWGRNNNGSLGDNTLIDKSSPIQIGADSNWSQVSIYGGVAASVKTDSTLWSWGVNGQGQIGDGTTIKRSSPIQIGTNTNWVKVVTGSLHTVARSS